MAVTVRNIIPRKNAETTQTGQYTATNCKTVIDKFTATNTTGSAITFNVHLVASGGSAGSANMVLTRSIAPSQTYVCPELVGQSLEAGGFISCVAGSSGLTISATGREIT